MVSRIGWLELDGPVYRSAVSNAVAAAIRAVFRTRGRAALRDGTRIGGAHPRRQGTVFGNGHLSRTSVEPRDIRRLQPRLPRSTGLVTCVAGRPCPALAHQRRARPLDGATCHDRDGSGRRRERGELNCAAQNSPSPSRSNSSGTRPRDTSHTSPVMVMAPARWGGAMHEPMSAHS